MIESLKLNSNDFLLYSINEDAANMHCAIDLSDYLTNINCVIHTLELKDGVTRSQLTPLTLGGVDTTKILILFCT